MDPRAGAPVAIISANFEHMPLTAGARLGSYEIAALIGEGGMGQVWRARDTKLNRDVALKILPEAFALDVDRLARFKREAQVLASLNQPNIAAIYGFGRCPLSRKSTWRAASHAIRSGHQLV
jgi:serine/threonine-protein kinase